MAFSASLRAGIRPAEFWELTPYQTRLALEAWSKGRDYDRKIVMAAAWFCAGFQRLTTMPKLDEWLGLEPAKEEDWRLVKARFCAFPGAKVRKRPKR